MDVMDGISNVLTIGCGVGSIVCFLRLLLFGL